MAFWGDQAPQVPFAIDTANDPATRTSALRKRERDDHSPPFLPDDGASQRFEFLPLQRTYPDEHFANEGIPRKAEPEEPWHLNDRFVRRFNQQELATYIEGLDPPSTEKRDPFALGNDFGCPIHPLFRSLAMLVDPMPDIAPALRLATRFLVSKYTLPFFHNLITMPLGVLRQESQHYQVPLLHLRPSPFADTGLPPQELQLTMQALVGLGPHIKFAFIPDVRIRNRWAYTERVNRPSAFPNPSPQPFDLHTADGPLNVPQQVLRRLKFHGTNTLINISPCFLQALGPAPSPRIEKPPPTNTPAQRLRAAYFLAITLIHELAHAVYLTRISPPPAAARPVEHEAFFADQRRAELGHALETTLFGGGKILSFANDEEFRVGLAWQRWPDSVNTFVADPRRSGSGNAIPLARLVWNPTTPNDDETWRRLRPTQSPRWETIYAIPDAWVKRQFYREFWDGVEQLGLRRTRALEVEKVLGVRCLNYDWEDRGSVEGDGFEDSASSYGRGDDEDGVVRPGQPWRGFEMPEEEDDDKGGRTSSELGREGGIGTVGWYFR